MKRFAFAAAVLALTVSAAPAATVGECLATLNGLQALDHYDAQEGGKTVAKQYKLGNIRYTLAMDMAELQRVMDATQKARQSLLLEMNDGAQPAPGSPKYQPFNDAFQAVLDKACEVKLATIKVEDLHLGDGPDQNAIPLSVIAAIRAILDPIDRVADAKK